MKNKILLIILIVSIAIILSIVIYKLFNKKEYNLTNSDILVSISSSNAFNGMISMYIEPEYFVYKDKRIIVKYDTSSFEKDYNATLNAQEYEIKITDEEYNQIYQAVTKKDFNKIKVKNNKYVMDGTSYFFSIYEGDKKLKTIGGYMVTNKELINIRKKIMNCVSENDQNNIRNIYNSLYNQIEEILK